MRLLLRSVIFALALAGCPKAKNDPVVATGGTTTTAPTAPADRGPPLSFALDPVDRDFDHQPESNALLGKRAVVVLLATWDTGSLMALRTLAPVLNDLPKDATCLEVAMQPIGDRELVAAFLDAEKTPCRRAIGDPKRNRLGDLAAVKVIPAVIVLRADGTVAGTLSGSFAADDVKKLLEKAR